MTPGDGIACDRTASVATTSAMRERRGEGRSTRLTIASGAAVERMGYPQGMTFTKQELDLVDQTKEVRIETSAPGGSKHRTIIWAVVDGGDVLIRSYYGPGARWYREALANPSVTLHVGDVAIPARAIPAADDASIASASAGFERKYAGDPAAVRMVRPEVRDLTLRLERS